MYYIEFKYVMMMSIAVALWLAVNQNDSVHLFVSQATLDSLLVWVSLQTSCRQITVRGPRWLDISVRRVICSDDVPNTI